ncbi:hypothetical protein [Saccharopolyspora sp. NPDC002686]|uniref:hypothetical protein n=1 Tax=Saccharopolyspora sp. NPDC002686 TaxID=3154541 RepID=UPI00332FE10F
MKFTEKAVAGLATATAVLLAASPAHAAPSEVTTGYVVVDAETGETQAEQNEHYQFRSASLVKLLIAIDYLENLDGAEIPAEDRALLEPMLRSSNDDAASALWVRGGQLEIIDRTVKKIGLTDTTPPDQPGAVKQGWSGFGEGPEPGEECQDSSNPALTASVLASPGGR